VRDDLVGHMSDVTALSPDDWRIIRSARLRSLQDSPGAFVSTYEREAAAGSHHARLRTSDLAEVQEVPLGYATPAVDEVFGVVSTGSGITPVGAARSRTLPHALNWRVSPPMVTATGRWEPPKPT